MNSVSLPVVHPPAERLKQSGRALHLAAAVLILAHAISHLHNKDSSALYFWCQLLISMDILLLVLAGRGVLRQQPGVNLFFRVVEVVFFLGIGSLMLKHGHQLAGLTYLTLCILYIGLLYFEKGFRREDLLSFHHTGVTIPGLPSSQFLLWTDINVVETHDDSIEISTSRQKTLHFSLRRNLEFAELDEIHEFCRHYLGT